MKIIIKIMAVILCLSFSLAHAEESDSANDFMQPFPMSDVEIADKENVTIFTITGGSEKDWNEVLAPYLATHYLETGEYTEVIITCRWAVDSDSPTLGCGRAREIYTSLKQSGISEDMLYISLRFEKDVPDDGVITVEFFKSSSYFKRAGENIVSGFTDIISSPVELPRYMINESKKNGTVTGVPTGVFSGFGAALRKAGTGAVKLLTFWAG